MLLGSKVQRIRYFMVIGVSCGIVFSFLAVLASGFRAEVEIRGRVFPIWQIVAAYGVAGVLGGGVTGLLVPLAKGRGMKILVGCLVGLIVGVAMGGILVSSEGAGAVVAGSIGGGLLGAVVGASL